MKKVIWLQPSTFSCPTGPYSVARRRIGIRFRVLSSDPFCVLKEPLSLNQEVTDNQVLPFGLHSICNVLRLLLIMLYLFAYLLVSFLLFNRNFLLYHNMNFTGV